MKTWLVLLCVCLLLCLLGGGQRVYAETPTPSPTWTLPPTSTTRPTLNPIQPTMTSKYGGLKLTPTPLTLTPQETLQAQFDTLGMVDTFADTTINAYRALNWNGILDIFSFFAIVLVLVMLLMRIQRRSTQNND